ncbi:SMI1/KNR4 family protein [Pseudomonas sp. TNT2022 ID233]|uniref:SMI1/KNR4 family protein n=1 Tax=Pseudomonas aphyarum TaxID=2942629 RepID=UPI002360788A|nr:SMI1/KNR4 family protein [Pseudomonas aphyarum]MDD1136643.1 SMI1/KNR4 family protein [Pseudomonas aphyarum]
MKSVRDIFHELVLRGVISEPNLVGCSEVDIASVEQHFGCEIPLAYRDFLTIAGRSAGKIFCGVDIFYPRLFNLKLEAEELLDELSLSGLLPADAKVFCMHQGYEINYFLPVSDDPPVFQFFEGQSSIAKAWDSFSGFLIASIESHLAQWPNLN